MKIDINLLLTIGGMVIALFIGFWANKNSSNELRNHESEAIKQSAYNDGRIDSKLDAISATVSRTDANIENLKVSINNVETRLAKVEESTKSAHHRLDRISDNKEE